MRKFFALGCIVLLLILGLFYFKFHALTLPKSLDKQSAQKTSNPLVITEDTFPHLLYFKNFEVWKLHPDGFSQQITQTGGTVNSFAYAPDQNLIAYIAGEKVSADSQSESVKPNQVVLQDLSTGKTTLILTLPEIDYPNNDYVRSLKDLAFSGDGTKLAVTSSDSVWIYDVNTKKVVQIFSKPFVPSSTNPHPPANIFGYTHPIFSPGNTQLMVTEAYPEGGNQVIMSTSTGAILNPNTTNSGFFASSQVPAHEETSLLKGTISGETLVGTDMYYLRTDANQKSTIVKLQADGTSQTWEVPPKLGTLENPVFAADFHILLFSTSTGTYGFDWTQPDKDPYQLSPQIDGAPFVVLSNKFDPNAD